MTHSQYKSNFQLKHLARVQMNGHFGLLAGAVLIPALISFLAFELIDSVFNLNYASNYIAGFIAQIILSVLQVGATLIYLKSACNMPSQTSDLFYGFKNNTAVALKIGFLFVFIKSVCTIPCELVNLQLADSIDTLIPAITETTTISEMMETYSVFYSAMLSYYGLMLCCLLASFLLKIIFVPAYYLMLDFPEWNTLTIIKKSIEIMRGNKLRYILLQISFLPLLFLSFFTCGLTLIWTIPYINMTNTNFYLDIMAVRNKTNI